MTGVTSGHRLFSMWVASGHVHGYSLRAWLSITVRGHSHACVVIHTDRAWLFIACVAIHIRAWSSISIVHGYSQCVWLFIVCVVIHMMCVVIHIMCVVIHHSAWSFTCCAWLFTHRAWLFIHLVNNHARVHGYSCCVRGYSHMCVVIHSVYGYSQHQCVVIHNVRGYSSAENIFVRKHS